MADLVVRLGIIGAGALGGALIDPLISSPVSPGKRDVKRSPALRVGSP
jgi:hypothetical protein